MLDGMGIQLLISRLAEQFLGVGLRVEECVGPAVLTRQFRRREPGCGTGNTRVPVRRRAAAGDAADSACSYERIVVVAGSDVGYPNLLPGLGGFDHLSVADVQPNVIRTFDARVGVEKDHVTSLKLVHVDGLAHSDLLIRRPRDAQTEVAIDLLDKPRAVDTRSHAVSAPDIRST